MAMNREQKRAMQKRGMATEDGEPAPNRERRAPAPTPKEERTSPRQYVREVVAELRKTSWPTRAETLRLSLIVLIAVVVLTLFIFGLDFVFNDLVGRLIDTERPTQAAALAPALFFLRPTRSR